MNYTLYVQKLSKTRSPINTAIIENMNIYQTLKHSQTTGQPYKLVRRVRRQALFFPTHTKHTHQNVKIHQLYQSKPQQQRSQAKIVVLFYSRICNVECSFVDITNDTKYRTFCFFPQVDRTENFASKMASLFRPIRRKKNLFSYALQTLALKYINFYALLSTYLGGAFKKLAKQVEKTLPNPGLVVLSILSQSPFELSNTLDFERKREQKHLVS